MRRQWVTLFTFFLVTLLLQGPSWVYGDDPTFTDSDQSISYNGHGVVLGDLDGDGDLDGIWGDKYCENNGSGTFYCRRTGTDYYPQEIGMGDLDGDGDLDLFLCINGSNMVWMNDGSGSFTDSGQVLGYSDSWDVRLGDLDGDGDLDAFISNMGPNTVWFNDGNGFFTDSGQLLGSSFSQAVDLGDLDGDGDLDALVAVYTSEIWINDGNGFFSKGQELTHESGAVDTVDVALADLDGDGDLDAFLANATEHSNHVWVNLDGSFFDSGQLLGSSSSQSVKLADLDNDGDIDAFVANTSENGSNQGNTIYLNDGTGLFSTAWKTSDNSDSWDLDLGDIDNDGDIDCVIDNTEIYGQTVTGTVWFNDLDHDNVTEPSTAPDTPAQFSPSGTTYDTAFSWSTSTGADTYSIWICDVSFTGIYFNTYSAADVETEGTCSTSIDPGYFEKGESYYWFVCASNEHGASWSWNSGGLWFQLVDVTTAPDFPTQYTPTGESTETLFTWSESPGAATYSIWVCNSTFEGVYFQTFNASDVENNGSCSAMVESSSFQQGTLYYWYICASNDYGDSWSWNNGGMAFWLMSPTTLPDAPTQYYPYGLTDDTTFTWGRSEGATSYEIYICDDLYNYVYYVPYTASEVEKGDTCSAYISENYFTPGQTYIWFAGASNDAGSSWTWDTGGVSFYLVDEGDCSFSISPSTSSFNASGGNATVTITASSSSCDWDNTYSGYSWISITPVSGNGDGTVTLTVSANDEDDPRSAIILIAGELFTVSQNGKIDH